MRGNTHNQWTDVAAVVTRDRGNSVGHSYAVAGEFSGLFQQSLHLLPVKCSARFVDVNSPAL